MTQARKVTGNLRVSLARRRGGPLVFAFANRRYGYGAALSMSCRRIQRSGVGGQSFAAIMGGDPRVDVYLYRVLIARTSRPARRKAAFAAKRRTRNWR
jgi:hypothetical protein